MKIKQVTIIEFSLSTWEAEEIIANYVKDLGGEYISQHLAHCHNKTHQAVFPIDVDINQQEFENKLKEAEEIGLQGARESEKRTEQSMEFGDELTEELRQEQINLQVIYSMGEPINLKGKVILHDPKGYTSPVLDSPDIKEIMRRANEMIHATGDYHHVFLEDIERSDQEIDGVPVYHFIMGS